MRSKTQDLFERVMALGQRAGTRALNGVQRIAYLVIELETVVPMEGLLGFYDTRLGNFAGETVAALEEIGAFQAAVLIRRANSLFPGGTPPTAQDERREVLWSLDEESLQAIDALGSKYLLSRDNVDAKLQRFGEAHEAELSEGLATQAPTQVT